MIVCVVRQAGTFLLCSVLWFSEVVTRKASMDSTLIIIQLNECKYPTYKIQDKMNLMKEDLYRIATGKETQPDGTDQNGGAVTVAQFLKRRDRRLALLVLSIEPKLQYLLGDPTDPVVVWKKLQSTF